MVKLPFVKQHKLLSLFLAYFFIGLMYGLAVYLQLLISGKQIVFSPLVGIPIHMVFWPMHVYANILHGMWPSDYLALTATCICVVILAKNWKA